LQNEVQQNKKLIKS